jgi:hypothetical protein
MKEPKERTERSQPCARFLKESSYVSVPCSTELKETEHFFWPIKYHEVCIKIIELNKTGFVGNLVVK